MSSGIIAHIVSGASGPKEDVYVMDALVSAGAWTGGVADIDEDINTPNETDLMFLADNDDPDEFRGSTDIIASGSPTIVDGDTVHGITVKIHCKDNDSSNRIQITVFIDGVSKGTQQINTNATPTTYTVNNAGWDVDWSASQLAGMEIVIRGEASGSPGDYFVYTLNVIVDAN